VLWDFFIFWEKTPSKEALALFQKEAKKIWQFENQKEGLEEKMKAEKADGSKGGKKNR